MQEINSDLTQLETDLALHEISVLLSGKYDNYGCCLRIQSGVGGAEAHDWTAMLYRMYKVVLVYIWCCNKILLQRFVERQAGWQMRVGEEMLTDTGFRSVEIEISGDGAYGMLRGEKGAHRLVRISPFNAQGKRMTTVCAVEVWPLLPDRDVENICIPEKAI